MKILVVDDDGPSRYLLKAILRPQGYEVLSASNGLEAIGILDKEKPDLIISDIMMPKMDGFQLLRHCKTDPELKSIPFIVYTANYTEEKDIALARDIGADMIIVKPIEPDEFLETINKVVATIPDIEVKEPVISAEEKEQYLQKYSERIVAKLDEKIAELQNRNRLLRAIRRINQMMVRIKDTESIFDHACRILINEAGYKGAWMVHFGTEGYVDIAKNAGFNETFGEFTGSLNTGDYPDCIRRALEGDEGIVVAGPKDRDRSCPVCKNLEDMECMLAGIRVAGETVGLIIIFLQPGQEVNEDEISLFSEIADDVSFSINTIEIDTKRKEAELEKIQSEEKYRQLFNNATDTIFLIEVNREWTKGRFLEINEAATSRLGYTHDELLEMDVSDVNTFAEKEDKHKILKELRDEGHAIFEGYHKQKTGSRFPVEIASHVFIMNGKKVVLSICRDISERKEMEKEIATAIQQIEDNLGQLAILNDEIRNPLTVIVACAEVTEGNIQDKIMSQAYEIDNIITQLDREWLNSEKIWKFLRKYYGIKQKERSVPGDGAGPEKNI